MPASAKPCRHRSTVGLFGVTQVARCLGYDVDRWCLACGAIRKARPWKGKRWIRPTNQERDQ